MPKPISLRLWLSRAVTILIATAVSLVLFAGPAFGHVDLESSSPADGAVVTQVPELIELRFTSEAVPAGDGLVLADGDGVDIDVSVSQPEPTVVHVVPVEPLDNGVYGVLWTMKAGDAHPKSGTFTFQVDAPLPPPVEEGALPLTTTSIANPETEPVEPEIVAEDAPVVEEAEDEAGEPEPSVLGEASTAAAVDLDPVFEEPQSGSDAGDWLARIGRWAAMTAALVGIGALAFAATSLTGTRREVEEAGFWVRRAGMLLIGGTILEVLGTSMGLAGSVSGGLEPSALSDLLAGNFGIAVALRLVGGLAMAAGTVNAVSTASAPVAVKAHGTSPTDSVGDVAVLDRPEPTYRLDVHRERLALIGVGLVAVSFLFDGHTVTTSPNLLVRSATAVHVLAAGVWVGGVLLMARTLATRHRRGAPLGAASMAIRFSRVASGALAGVAIAGIALAVAILDAPSELATTSWGRVLVLKVIAVAVAAGIGAYNHFAVVPVLDRDPTDDTMTDRLSRLVRTEGVILLIVIALTAILVGLAA